MNVPLVQLIGECQGNSGKNYNEMIGEKRPNIIMIGPDLNVQGGISFVIKEYLDSGLDKLVTLRFIPTHRDGSKLYKVWVFIKGFLNIIFSFLQIPIAIVHLHMSQDGSFIRKFIIFISSKLFGKKTIIHLHGANFEEFMNKSPLHQFLTRWMFNRADRVLVLSNRWEVLLNNFTHSAHITVLYNPIMPKMLINQNGNALKIIFLGRLGQRKGTYDLIESIYRNKNYFLKRNIFFILGGDGDVEKIRALVKEQGLDACIEVPGWLSQQEKVQLLESSHIMILPSYNEQMPMSILEGMAYGYPIISTTIAGIPEMVENEKNGFLIDPGDIQGMTIALKKLCEDRPLRERMGKISLEIIKEKFESHKIISKLVEIYQEISDKEIVK